MNPFFLPGERVQAHPGTDAWMQGDRYGTILSANRDYVIVLMDVSGRTLTFTHDNLEPA